MSTIIQISNLSKIYRLGEIGTGTISLDLERWYRMKIRGQEDPFLKIGEANKRDKKGISNIVYSLRDINLEIQEGESLGIIGKNGAGKSTLLKIISRVTSPTTGKIKIKGRVASLLEVGTGFHPELTGRENIYLNGAILGMRKKEITRKLDEIIDFSGVERYIDTPVKRYSSGMYVRLAFAVAAHLESEILIVDEVLAVGDAEFQKKCLGKMGDISKGEGRTVLFVSHNMGAISDLCRSSLVLKDGLVAFQGQTNEAVSLYLEKYRTPIPFLQRDRNALGNEHKFIEIFNANSSNQIQNEFRHDEEIRIVFEVYIASWDDRLNVAIYPCDKYGRRIFLIDIPLKDYYKGEPLIKLAVVIPGKVLVPENYSWMIYIHFPLVTLYEYHESICEFSILETGSVLSRYSGFDSGVVYAPEYSIITFQDN